MLPAAPAWARCSPKPDIAPPPPPPLALPPATAAAAAGE